VLRRKRCGPGVAGFAGKPSWPCFVITGPIEFYRRPLKEAGSASPRNIRVALEGQTHDAEHQRGLSQLLQPWIGVDGFVKRLQLRTPFAEVFYYLFRAQRFEANGSVEFQTFGQPPIFVEPAANYESCSIELLDKRIDRPHATRLQRGLDFVQAV
jgi:hypothetical protein